MTAESRERIAAALRGMAKRRGMSDRALSLCSLVPERSLGAYMRAERDVPGGRLDALCIALGCTVPQLLALAASADHEPKEKP